VWLLELIVGIGDLILYWRLHLILCVTGAICCFFAFNVTSDIVLWSLCIPLAIAGGTLGAIWQIRSERNSFHRIGTDGLDDSAMR
jgi:hypothetical protein